jgi:pilus assembly protein CpaC
MHRIFAMPWLLTGALSALLLGGVPAVSLAQTCSPEVKPLVVLLNSTTRLQLSSKKPIKTVMNPKEGVLTLRTVERDPTTVLLVGTAPGVTTLELEDADGRREVRNVIVQADVEYLTSQLRRAVPLSNVDVIPNGTNSVILTGYTNRAEDIAVLQQVATSVGFTVINGVRLNGVQQVQLDVVIARVNRNKGRNFGFNFFLNGRNGIFGQTTGNLATLGGPIGVPSGALQPAQFGQILNATPGGNTNLFGGVIGNNQGFLGFLQALQNEGVAKVLAQPRLVTKSGQPASFLDGGEQAVPVPAGLGQVGVQFEEFGTRLNFLPIVLGNGRIHLEVEPEVSALDAGAGVVIAGATVPGRATQRVHTTVEMETGQTFVIGGLIQKVSTTTATKVPVLGQIPFLGTFFSTKTATESETELVVMVTPHLVDAQSACQVSKVLPGQESRTPDNFELFLEGILEAPRGPRKVFQGNRYVPAHLNGPAANLFPCGGHDDGLQTRRISGRAGSVAGGACSTEAPTILGGPAPVNVVPVPAPVVPRIESRLPSGPVGDGPLVQMPGEAVRLPDPVRPPEALPLSSLPGGGTTEVPGGQ